MACSVELAISIVYPTTMSGIVVKNNQEILLDLADFALQEQPEDNLMIAISRAWYNGSCTMAAKPIKSLQMHYIISDLVLISLSLFFVFYFRIRPSELYGPFRSVSKPCWDNFSSVNYHKKQKRKTEM